MIKLETARLSEILPSSLLRDEKIKALAQALDTEIINLTAATREVLFLPRLDELSGPILDLLCNQFHVDFYEPLYLDDETKKKLIRESIAWHKRKGTRWAVERICEQFSHSIKIKEWYEYGGNPYWFKVITKPFKSEDDLHNFYSRLKDAKNVRSHCSLELQIKAKNTTYVGIGQYKHGRKRLKPARLYAGIGIYKTGRKRYYPSGTATYSDGFITIIDGTRTLIISKSRVIIRYDGEKNIFGDQLRMTFDFPTAQRTITLPNPREDLTVEDVQAVSDFVVENKILLKQGEEPNNLHRAVIVTTNEEILF